MPTIRDVAKEAGVTPATVSYVLNNSGRVSDATRERVLAAVRKLDYRPSIVAQNLRAGESRIIGYAWHRELPGEWTPVMQQFLYNLAAAAERAGYHILTFISDADDPVSSYLTLADTGRVDGFVLADTVSDDIRVRRLLDMNIPFVAFGRANDNWNFTYVDVDGEHGMYMVVQHLIALGHQRIALVGWPAPSLSGTYRREGYLKALQQAGLPAEDRLMMAAENTSAGGYRAACQLMSLSRRLRPTAIVCMSDVIAIGVMQCLGEKGCRIGQDIAVTGFDDIPTASYLNPPLTSVRQPLDMITDHLMRFLLEMLRAGTVEHKHSLLVDPILVVRASSGGSGKN